MALLLRYLRAGTLISKLSSNGIGDIVSDRGIRDLVGSSASVAIAQASKASRSRPEFPYLYETPFRDPL